MSVKMIPISGEQLKKCLKEKKLKQKDVDDYLGYSKAIGNYVHRNEIPVYVKDVLEFKFDIPYENYKCIKTIVKKENKDCMNIHDILLQSTTWNYCPICGTDLERGKEDGTEKIGRCG